MGAPGELISILEVPMLLALVDCGTAGWLSARGCAFVDMGLVTICQSQSGSGGGHTVQRMPG